MNEEVELTYNDLNITLGTAAEYYKGATRIGHALSKHAGRKPKIWGKIEGSMRNWHEQALRHFNDIYHGPGKFVRVTSPKGISFLEKRLPDGRGIRLNSNYTFKGFID